MGFLGLTNNTTYNYTTINLLQILASQVRANVFLTWIIISRWAEGTRNGPGVGSGCSAVSSQGEGPGLDQEWGKGGVPERLAAGAGVSQGCQEGNLEGVPRWS